MKKSIRILPAVLLALFAATAARAADLVLEVGGVEQATGEILVALYGKDDPWMRKPRAGQRVAATAGTTRVVFRELPEGDYAAVIFQDLDGDRRLARNSFGLPLEPWGFTNDAAAPFGPPGFDAARITVAGTGATAVVHLRTQPPEPVAAR